MSRLGGEQCVAATAVDDDDDADDGCIFIRC